MYLLMVLVPIYVKNISTMNNAVLNIQWLLNFFERRRCQCMRLVALNC